MRFIKHSRREVLSAFLALASRDNAVLKQILQDPHHSAYLALVDELLHNPRGAVVRLLLSFLDDSHAPSAAITTLSRRSDPKFVKHLLRKIGFEPSAAAAINLKRVDNIAWVRQDERLIDTLEEAEQHSLVQMLMASGIKRLEVFKTIEHLIRAGKPAGRRAAAQALARFNGSEANTLALQALEDADAYVQAAVLPQIRQRGIPGALSRLVDFTDSPHDMVRQAACESLSEFSFDRFLAAFDMLDDHIRQSTGELVRRINPHALPGLIEEMLSRSRTRRLRAVGVAISMGVIGDIEPTIIELLSDEDHVVRSEAVRALGYSNSESSRQALREALLDRSIVVQEIAERSLRATGCGRRTPRAARGADQMTSARELVLLAQRSSLFRDMGSGFREKREHFDATDLFFWFLIVIGIFVALGILARVLGRHDKHRLYNSPRALFRALCRAHALDRRDRRLLLQIAKSEQLNPPARLFLEPACFQLSRLGPEFQSRRTAIEDLAKKIFAAAPPADPVKAPAAQ